MCTAPRDGCTNGASRGACARSGTSSSRAEREAEPLAAARAAGHAVVADGAVGEGEMQRAKIGHGTIIMGAAVIIDSHVHLFPPRVFDAIWRWFDRHAWNIQYRLYAEEVLAHMREHGVARVVGLCY